MFRLDIPDTIEGFDAFRAFMSSGRVPSGMSVSELDGLLTAIAIGPRLIKPSEWLPQVWYRAAPEFADEAEARAVIGELLNHFNAILDAIEDCSFQPILLVDRDGTLVPLDWASGFLRVVDEFLDDWNPLFASKEKFYLLIPILALGSDEEDEPLIDLKREDEDQYFDEAADLLPRCVLGIVKFWRGRGQGPGRQTGRKPARNEPCPCPLRLRRQVQEMLRPERVSAAGSG